MEKVLDSGARREFGTGAVRDVAEGKGRADLLPYDVVKQLVGPGDDPVLEAIGQYKDGGDPGYLVDATRAVIDTLFEDPFTALLELSMHFEAGALKYGDANWELGIPLHCYLDSATRHYLKYLRGDEDERHDRACLWNLVCAAWTHDRYPELRDSRTRVPELQAAAEETFEDNLGELEEDEAQTEKPKREFKAGDRVRIRQWGDMKKEFGLDPWDDINCRRVFAKSMRHLCGRSATVVETVDGGGFIVLSDWSDTSGCLSWQYSADMLESADDEMVADDTPIEPKEEPPKREFKVGDQVRIRQWGDMKKEFGLDEDGNIELCQGFIEDMRHLCGQTAEIRSINPNGRIYLHRWSEYGDHEWTFSADMLELVEGGDSDV